MISNYLKMAWRNLASAKFYSALNLGGLTLGLAVGLLILLWVNNELSYDRFHRNAGNLYRMNINLQSNGNKFSASVVQAPIAPLAIKEVPGVENAVRVTDHNDYASFRYQETSLKGGLMVYTDPSLFTMFDYKIISGNIQNLFPDPYSLVLTQSAARRFFGEADPMGKILVADNKTNFTVTGVIADFPENGWINAEMLFSTELQKIHYTEQGRGSLDETDWGNYYWAVFLQLQPNASVPEIEDKLSKLNYTHQPHMKPVDAGSYTLQPLLALHLYSAEGNATGMKVVRIFVIIAGLILLIASINYVNLSTARALLRTREVSVRKVIGASRKQLFLQFVVQTMLFFAIALVLAFGVMMLLMPLYNSLSGKHLYFDLFDASLWKVIGSTLLLTLLATSIYPALLLSSFKPIDAMRGKIAGGMSNSLFRKILVVGQFAFSVGLIICTVIIARQLAFFQSSSLGYDKSHVFSVDMNKMSEHAEAAVAELQVSPLIEGVTTANGNISQRYGATLDVDWDGKDPNGSLFVHDLVVDKNFFAMMKMEMVSGSAFTGAATDSTHLIVNETAVKEIGLKDPIGKRLRWHQVEGTIVGVAKDFHFTSLRQKIDPFVFAYQPSNSQLYVKASGQNIPGAIKAVEAVWSKYNPGAPFDYQFMEETYAKQYESEQRTGKLFELFSGIAIAISCLGLLGLATYTAQMKVKEIGIRKVLGASAAGITLMLSKTFISLIGVSILIAVPVAAYTMQKWMEGFAYRTTLPWWIFAGASLAVVVIAMLTIGFQTLRAAVENPVKSLRGE